MGKRWTGVIPADKDRCTRNDGKSWRCYVPRLAGAIYCQKHQLAYLAKCSSSSSSNHHHHHSPTPLPPLSPPPPKVKPTPKTRKTSVSKVPKSKVFGPKQIWASSSSSPPNPFIYCRIDCRNPSESSIQVTPLIPHPVLEEEIKWVDNGGGGRPIACGTFRPSPKKPAMEIDASTLSFKVGGVKTVHWMGIPFYRIFPNKGEIWAVRSKDGGGGDSKLVEILTEFSEGEGVTVAGLVPVVGSGGGVYEKGSYDGFQLVQTYGRREMVMFERRVLAEKVEGNDDSNQQLWKVMLR